LALNTPTPSYFRAHGKNFELFQQENRIYLVQATSDIWDQFSSFQITAALRRFVVYIPLISNQLRRSCVKWGEQEAVIWRVLTSTTTPQFPVKFCRLVAEVLFRRLVKDGEEEIGTLHSREVSR
jgi:hypothetical protein